MAHFAGLDVSIEETAVCVVDDQGTVLMQGSVATEPAAIAKALAPFAATLKRAGHEAGSLWPWLHPELKAQGIPVVCLETRQVRAAMSAQRNKTDATDALGPAHLMRTGWFRQAHVKTEGAYRLKLLLTHRRNLKRKFLDLENAIRHSLKSFGVKLHKVGRAGFEQAVREASAEDALTAELMDCMLTARAALWRQYLKLHNLVVKLAEREGFEPSIRLRVFRFSRPAYSTTLAPLRSLRRRGDPRGAAGCNCKAAPVKDTVLCTGFAPRVNHFAPRNDAL